MMKKISLALMLLVSTPFAAMAATPATDAGAGAGDAMAAPADSAKKEDAMKGDGMKKDKPMAAKSHKKHHGKHATHKSKMDSSKTPS